MFLQGTKSSNEAPLIEPLRIQKRSSATSTASGTGQQQSSGTSYPMPSLPYPDDMARQQQLQAQAAQAQSNANGSPAYQYPDPRRVGSPQQNRFNSASPFDPTQRVNSAGSERMQESAQSAQSTLAERRGNSMPKPLPDSPGPEAPDKDLFQRPVRSGASASAGTGQPSNFPAPTVGNAAQAAFARLNIRDPNTINRIDSTASTSTTRATRGSPPPPETPLVLQQAQASISRPLTDIEQRFANSGIAGAGTLNALQAQQVQSAAAQARNANYGGRKPSSGQTQQQQPPPRPWTPTELPGVSPHPAPIVFQGDSEVTSQSPPPQQQQQQGRRQSQSRSDVPQSTGFQFRPNPAENDIHSLPMSDEPPPAYSSVTGVRPGSQYPLEKGRQSTLGPNAVPAQVQAQSPAPQPIQQQPLHQQPIQQQPIQQPQPQQHPAFANEPQYAQGPSPGPQQNGMASPMQSAIPQRQLSQHLSPASPPPLPEGWIAHLDPNSGQYYYIHLPTQATQWEFPKGPTPLNLGETPLSPTGSMAPLQSPGLSFMNKPLNSPGIPLTPGFDQQSIMSGSLSNPAAFTGPPPSSGVELYKVAATNNVYFGPYLRYTNMDLELGFWYGSILLVTDAPQPPTIHLHQSLDLSPNPRQLKAQNIAQHQRWVFYKYDVDLRMEIDGPAKWTYAITSHLGCTRYEFLVAGRYETNWRFIATSGNDFSINTGANERARLGGVGYMWKDIMQKHAECGGFHVQLGLGGQISADRMWKEIPSLRQWLGTSGKENRKNATWTAAHEEDVSHAYFHYYTSHFDQPQLREAFAQIPYVSTIDDHDM